MESSQKKILQNEFSNSHCFCWCILILPTAADSQEVRGPTWKMIKKKAIWSPVMSLKRCNQRCHWSTRNCFKWSARENILNPLFKSYDEWKKKHLHDSDTEWNMKLMFLFVKYVKMIHEDIWKSLIISESYQGTITYRTPHAVLFSVQPVNNSTEANPVSRSLSV